MADTNKKNNFLDYEGLSLFWNNVKKVIEDNELVTATALTNLDTRVVQLEDKGSNQGAASNQIIAISYADLKTLRDNAQLVPGQQYRITDYTCTTTQENTRAVGHRFDIIVTALDEFTLSEEAHAIQNIDDRYFDDSNLSAWKIWYCLDNDTIRFKWADETNGKGVIYRMIDEFDNDIPYDFKNIQFKHPNDTTTYPHYYYTFASDNIEDNTDCSLNINIPCMCYSNTIRNTISMEDIAESPMMLNQIIFIGAICFCNSFGNFCFGNSFGSECISNSFGNLFSNNSFGSDCSNNTFRVACTVNTFGDGCRENIFGNGYHNNTFGNNCQSNTFGNDCQGNTFGGGCQSNTFGNDCVDNTIGNNYQSNTFGNDCTNNTIGDNFQSNTLGNDCGGNTFGNDCANNSFGNGCYDNTFGNDCANNSFGNGCYDNTFGNSCYNNIFGNECQYIKFASDSSGSATKYKYYQYNHFGDGCQYIVFTGAETASASAQVQNYNFAQGLKGTETAYLTIDGVRNRVYETKVAKNSVGELKIYCEADLIQ